MSRLWKENKIIKNYLFSWFVLDLMASFPYQFTIELVFTNNPNSSVNSLSMAPRLIRIIKIVKFLRILRLLRVLKLKKVLYKLEEHIVADHLNAAFDGLKLLWIILLINHMMACIFYFIGTFDNEYDPDSWVYLLSMNDRYTKFEIYVQTYYWAFSTMSGVGYGDVRPFSNIEKIYGMACMIITTGFNAYMIGALSTIFNRSSMISQEMKLRSLHINQFLIHHEIPYSLRVKIMSYLDFLVEYKQHNKLDDNEVLELLNDNLREQVIAFLNGRILKECKAFDSFDMILLSEITFMMERKLYSMSDNIFEEGDISRKMYFISKGGIRLLHLKSHTYIKELSDSESIGEASFFSNRKRCATARSCTFTEMLVLDLHNFEELLNNHEDEKQLYKEMRKEISKDNDLTVIRVRCFICDEIGHMAPE